MQYEIAGSRVNVLWSYESSHKIAAVYIYNSWEIYIVFRIHVLDTKRDLNEMVVASRGRGEENLYLSLMIKEYPQAEKGLNCNQFYVNTGVNIKLILVILFFFYIGILNRSKK